MNAVVQPRRRFLTATTAVVGAAGLTPAMWPFIASWRPSARALAGGSPVTADLSKLEPGQQITVRWRGKPVWLLRRTPEMLAALADLDDELRDPGSSVVTQQPDYARNAYRAIRPEYLVVIGICTHLGCVPTFRPDVAPPDLGAKWRGGYFCPCHGSRFDLAGRVYKGVPAPTNLVVPPYRFVSDTRVEIGSHAGA